MSFYGQCGQAPLTRLFRCTTVHAAAQAEQQVQRALLRDVVVRERAPVLELLAGKDETLLVGRDACEPQQS